MKKYNLLGIGNALIDIQIDATEKELANSGLNKSEMQLVDIERQDNLIKSFGDKELKMSGGGSAANTIIAFAQFGGKAAYQTSIGKDKLGDYYSKEFTNLGIDLFASKLDAYPTGSCLTLITPDAERTMATALGASAWFKPEDVSEEAIKNSEWIYIEGYEFSQVNSLKAVFKAIEFAKKNGVKIALAFSDVFIIENFRKDIELAVEQSDLVCCNEQEAKNFAKMEDLDEILKSSSLKDVDCAVTLGKNGSIIKRDGDIHNVTAYETKAIDTTGAGDMFAAGFLYGLINENDAVKGAQLGSLAAARVVSQYGARLSEEETEIQNEIFKP